MTQYFFHTTQDAGGPDGDPFECESSEHARRQAVLIMSDMLREHPDAVWNEDVRLDVTTADGLILFSVMVVGVQSPAAATGLKPTLPL